MKAAATVLATAALALAAGCGGSEVTAAGTVTVSDSGSYGSAGDDTGCLSPQGTQGVPQLVSPGTLVSIRAPGGVVIGTAALSSPAAGSAPGSQCVFRFRAAGLPRESRYGVSLPGKGTAWFRPSQISRAHAWLGDGTTKDASSLSPR